VAISSLSMFVAMACSNSLPSGERCQQHPF
jgi:hypothetical protein